MAKFLYERLNKEVGKPLFIPPEDIGTVKGYRKAHHHAHCYLNKGNIVLKVRHKKWKTNDLVMRVYVKEKILSNNKEMLRDRGCFGGSTVEELCLKSADYIAPESYKWVCSREKSISSAYPMLNDVKDELFFIAFSFLFFAFVVSSIFLGISAMITSQLDLGGYHSVDWGKSLFQFFLPFSSVFLLSWLGVRGIRNAVTRSKIAKEGFKLFLLEVENKRLDTHSESVQKKEESGSLSFTSNPNAESEMIEAEQEVEAILSKKKVRLKI